MPKQNSIARKKGLNIRSIMHTNNIANHQKLGDRKTTNAVVDRYFEIVAETVLNGFEWQLPITKRDHTIHRRVNVGAMNICVQRTEVREAKRRDIATNQMVYDLRRPNEQNRIVGYCDEIKTLRYKFVPSKEFKDRLQVILDTTYKQYRLAP